jgi:hypothetical protein
MKAPYTSFWGETRMIPVVIHGYHGILERETTWDEELWVERPEDWYAMQSPQLRNKRVRIVTREAWLNESSLVNKL